MPFVAVQIRFGSENGLLKSKLPVFLTLKPCYRAQNTFECSGQLSNLFFSIHSKGYEALQDIVYIRLPPGINFGISLKRSEITEMGCFWSPLDS